MERGMWLLHFPKAALAIIRRNSYSRCITTFEQRVWSFENVLLNARLLSFLYNILFSFLLLVYQIIHSSLYCTVSDNEEKQCPLLPACLPVSVLSPPDWNITSGFVTVYCVETGTLRLWLICLLYRSATRLSGRTPGITLTALIPTVSTQALVWADFIKATTVWWMTCSPWQTTARLFNFTATRPVQLLQFLPVKLW